MHPLNNSFSIAVVGAWNPSIFTPDWVSRHLSSNEDEEVQIAFNIGDPTSPRKISFESIDILPGRRQLALISNTSNLDGIQKCSNTLLKILNLLKHTPVLGMGVNFSFLEKNPSEGIFSALMPSDNSLIIEKYRVLETKIERTLKVSSDDNFVLNFSLHQGQDGDSVLSFNFHYEATALDDCNEIISQNIVESHLATAVQFAKDCYDIDLDDTDDEE